MFLFTENEELFEDDGKILSNGSEGKKGNSLRYTCDFYLNLLLFRNHSEKVIERFHHNLVLSFLPLSYFKYANFVLNDYFHLL